MKKKDLPKTKTDFVIITALSEERDAVLQKLPGWRKLPPSTSDIRVYFSAELPVIFPDNTTGTYSIIVTCLSGMGRKQAVDATNDAIRQWHPRYVLLVGIAGGINTEGICIGDIIIADQIVDYELQKITEEGPEVRWDVHQVDPRLLVACKNFIDESWQQQIGIDRPAAGQPDLHFGTVASGDKVIAFSEILLRYQKIWPKLKGVEMEATGVAAAAFQSVDHPGFFMVRGVSDLADKDKDKSSVKQWRLYACNAAASFAAAFLRSGPIPLSGRFTTGKISRVELILDGEFRKFTPDSQQNLVAVLAALLQVDQSQIRVVKVREGSIVLTIELPSAAANRLYEMARKRDARLLKQGIHSLLMEGKEEIKLTVEITGRLEDQSEQVQNGAVTVRKDPMKPPLFQIGGVVKPADHFNQKKAIENLVQRILTGQSSTVAGDPRSGKTSLLTYLSAPENTRLYQHCPRHLVFRLIDAQGISSSVQICRFWEMAFASMIEQMGSDPASARARAAYQACQSRGFEVLDMEPFMSEIIRCKWQLVLMIDEFDSILDHPELNSSDFYGSLRTLSSRFGEALTIILTTRQTLGALNEATRVFSKKGSPYFNHMVEIALLPFDEAETGKFLTRVCPAFEQSDHDKIYWLTGGHPYFVQVAGKTLWDAKQDKNLPAKEQLVTAGDALLREVSPTLAFTWNMWTNEIRKVFSIIALDENPLLLEGASLDLNSLTRHLNNHPNELQYLEYRGYIAKDKTLPGGWRVCGQVMSWWVGNTLAQLVIEKDDLARFILAEKWDGLLKAKEKAQVGKAMNWLGDKMKSGIEIAIRAAVEGWSKTLK